MVRCTAPHVLRVIVMTDVPPPFIPLSFISPARWAKHTPSLFFLPRDEVLREDIRLVLVDLHVQSVRDRARRPDGCFKTTGWGQTKRLKSLHLKAELTRRFRFLSRVHTRKPDSESHDVGDISASTWANTKTGASINLKLSAVFLICLLSNP